MNDTRSQYEKARDMIVSMELGAMRALRSHTCTYVVQDEQPWGSELLVEARRGFLWGWRFRWTFRGRRISRRRAIEIMEKNW